MLQIHGESTIDTIERRLWDSRTAGSDALCATNVRYAHFGGEAALAQLLVTWARFNERPTLRLYEAPGSDALEDFVKTFHGLVAVSMATRVTIRDSAEDLKDRATLLVAQRLEAMNKLEFFATTKGVGAALVCPRVADLEFLQPLYEVEKNGKRRKFKEESEISSTMEKVFTAAVGTRDRQLKTEDRDVLAALAYELLRNTDEHARTDAVSVEYDRSVRAMLLRLHRLDQSTLSHLAEGFAPCATYLRRLTEASAERTINLLELSILDSGLGLAKRRLNPPGSQRNQGSSPKERKARNIEEERSLVLSCLYLRQTTKTSFGAGMGLFRAMSHLRERRGFLRLRTGRLSFIYDPQLETLEKASNEHFRVIDSYTLTEVPTIKAPVAGSLYTILLPVMDFE
jgi:hypothetical protein